MKSEKNNSIAARLWLDGQGNPSFQFAPRCKEDLFNSMCIAINAFHAEILAGPDGVRRDCQIGLRDLLAEALHQLREEQAFWDNTPEQ